ncbi:MAG: TatD family hydrolase [Dehalococcoidia bacterium]
MLIDSHAHLDAFPERQLHGVLARARRAGVEAILAPGADLASSQQCAALSRRFSGGGGEGQPRVVAAVGVHPAFLSGPLDGATLASLRSLTAEPGVVAVGEVGLDDSGPAPALQVEVFRLMLRLAREVELPVVLHCEADVVLSLVEREGAAQRGAVVHYFTGDAALARRCIGMGLYISVGRPLVRRPRLQRVVRELPLERLLLETDTYPMPRRATEPAHVRQVAQKLAEIRGISPEQVARETTANFNRLFEGG